MFAASHRRLVALLPTSVLADADYLLNSIGNDTKENRQRSLGPRLIGQHQAGKVPALSLPSRVVR